MKSVIGVVFAISLLMLTPESANAGRKISARAAKVTAGSVPLGSSADPSYDANYICYLAVDNETVARWVTPRSNAGACAANFRTIIGEATSQDLADHSKFVYLMIDIDAVWSDPSVIQIVDSPISSVGVAVQIERLEARLKELERQVSTLSK